MSRAPIRINICYSRWKGGSVISGIILYRWNITMNKRLTMCGSWNFNETSNNWWKMSFGKYYARRCCDKTVLFFVFLSYVWIIVFILRNFLLLVYLYSYTATLRLCSFMFHGKLHPSKQSGRKTLRVTNISEFCPRLENNATSFRNSTIRAVHQKCPINSHRFLSPRPFIPRREFSKVVHVPEGI